MSALVLTTVMAASSFVGALAGNLAADAIRRALARERTRVAADLVRNFGLRPRATAPGSPR